MAIPAPKYTQVPNILLDEWMQDMSDVELRVTLCAIRKIIGYHKEGYTDEISLTQFQKMTGLSRQGVLNGIEAAIKRGNLRKVANDNPTATATYQLVFEDDSASQQNRQADENSWSTELTSASQHSRPVLVNTVDTQKKGSKDSKRKKNPPLPPQGECDAKTPDDEYTTMSNSVKSLLKQHNKTQRHSIVNALLQRHTGNKADMNVECLMTVEMLGEFCLWWDKTKIGRDSKPLTRPKNQGSVKQWVDEWLSERNSVTPVTNQPTRDIREIFKGRYIPVVSTGE